MADPDPLRQAAIEWADACVTLAQDLARGLAGKDLWQTALNQARAALSLTEALIEVLAVQQ